MRIRSEDDGGSRKQEIVQVSSPTVSLQQRKRRTARAMFLAQGWLII